MCFHVQVGGVCCGSLLSLRYLCTVQAANYGRWRRFIVSVVTSVKPVCICTKIFGNYIAEKLNYCDHSGPQIKQNMQT